MLGNGLIAAESTFAESLRYAGKSVMICSRMVLWYRVAYDGVMPKVIRNLLLAWFVRS